MKRRTGFLALILVIAGLYTARWTITRASDAVATQGGYLHGWSVPKNVSPFLPDGPEATWPSMNVSADGNVIYVAWSDRREATQDIYFSVSIDGGSNWATSQPAAVTSRDSLRPSLVVSGTTPVVAWAEESATGFTHTTLQWSWDTGQVTAVPNDRTWWASTPRLASAPGGELFLVTQGGLGNQTDVLFAHRGVGAAAWSTATVVFNHTATGSHYPAIAVSEDGSDIHLVWQENVSTDESAIYYLQGYHNGGETIWDAPLMLSTGITRSVRPAIALGTGVGADQNVHVVWGELADGYWEQFIRYSRSNDGGATWSDPAKITAQPVSANNVAPTYITPSVAAASFGTVCVGWHGFYADAVAEAEEIFLSCSADGGDHWEGPMNISKTPSAISIRPVLVIGRDGFLHVAWQELAGANPVHDYQIYYARGFPFSVMLPEVRR